MGHDPDGLVARGKSRALPAVGREILAAAQQVWRWFPCRAVTAVTLTATSLMAFAVDAGAQTERLSEFVRRINDDLQA